MLPGISSLTKAFLSPALGASVAATQQFSQSRFASPLPPPPPPEEPFQYLPRPGPYATGGTWGESCGSIASFAEITALFIGIGAVLGLSAELCCGQRTSKPEDTQPLVPEPETDEQKSLSSKSIDNFSEWAERNYEEQSPPEDQSSLK
jgi:hypothetical protein